MNYRIIPNSIEEIAPPTLLGVRPFPIPWKDYKWFESLPANTYFALWVRGSSERSGKQIELPLGHDLYVISFHYEHLDCEWVIQQAKKIKQPIIILNDSSDYSFVWPENVHFFNFYSWHIHLDQIMTWFPSRHPRKLKYKISSVCNRITQSKLIVTTAILENFPRDQILVKLGTWLEEKNVHDRSLTGFKKLDNLSEIFFDKYFGNEILIDDFKDKTHNFQRVNSNPWQPLYLESAIHLTNQSYHYSYMIDDLGRYIRPGPCIDEKTFKCLLAQTPFISVGQFDVYNQLQELGLRFDYNKINLSWDQDPGNLSRLGSIVDCIIDLKNYSIDEIDQMTRSSSEYNADFIWSGDFYQRCSAHNEKIVEKILLQF